MKSEVIKRTSKGLVDSMFDAIDNLNAKRIDAEHARALSHAARTIVSVASLELDMRKFNREVDGNNDLKSLQIEGAVSK